MPLARWMPLLMAFAVSTACLCQNAAGTNPRLTESNAPVRDIHSTSSDLAVPICPASFNDSLTTDGIADARDKSATPPKVTHSVEAEFSGEAREALGVVKKKKKNHPVMFDGVSAIKFVVDDHGSPQGLCISKSIGYSLDANAAKAVQQYRFEPAARDGKPVPYRMAIEINYTFYPYYP
jgi:TonB family protein